MAEGLPGSRVVSILEEATRAVDAAKGADAPDADAGDDDASSEGGEGFGGRLRSCLASAFAGDDVPCCGVGGGGERHRARGSTSDETVEAYFEKNLKRAKVQRRLLVVR